MSESRVLVVDADAERAESLRTVLRDDRGGAVEILDYAPRFKQHGRIYHPVMLVRRLLRKRPA